MATIGAIIKIGDRKFALTAAHCLSSQERRITDLIADADLVNPKENEIFDEGFFDLFDEDDNPKLPAEAVAVSDASTQAAFELNTSRSVFLTTSRGSRTTTSEEDVVVSKRGKRGPQIAHLTGRLTVSQSLYDAVAEQHANPDLDWALLTLKHEIMFNPINWIQIGKSTVTTLVPSKEVPRGEVLVVSKATQYRRAYCSGVLALISLPGSDELRTVYSISAHSSAAGVSSEAAPSQGESGSLVVDANSGEAYGLIVAESSNLQLTYMMPIQDIFEDIRKKWHGDSVGFWKPAPEKSLSSTPKDDIRLFVLEAGSADEIIRGTLISSRPEFGDYDFLSYLWETRIVSQPIIVDGKTLLIPQSLEDMLRCLRFAERPRTLWVDAICTNIDDSAEQSRIIPQYSRIASGATQVRIWLGKEGEDTKLAFDVIEDFGYIDGHENLWGGPDAADRI